MRQAVPGPFRTGWRRGCPLGEPCDDGGHPQGVPLRCAGAILAGSRRIAPRVPELGTVTFCRGVARGERIVGATLVVALRLDGATRGRRVPGPFPTGWWRDCPLVKPCDDGGHPQGVPLRWGDSFGQPTHCPARRSWGQFLQGCRPRRTNRGGDPCGRPPSGRRHMRQAGPRSVPGRLAVRQPLGGTMRRRRAPTRGAPTLGRFFRAVGALPRACRSSRMSCTGHGEPIMTHAGRGATGDGTSGMLCKCRQETAW